jgi:hypothetical protein
MVHTHNVDIETLSAAAQIKAPVESVGDDGDSKLIAG